MLKSKIMKYLLTFILSLFVSASLMGQDMQESSSPSEPVVVYIKADAPLKGASYPLATKIRGGLKKSGCRFTNSVNDADYAVVASASIEKFSETSFKSYDGVDKVMYVVTASVNLAIKDLDSDEVIYNDIIETKNKVRDSDYNRASKKAILR